MKLTEVLSEPARWWQGDLQIYTGGSLGGARVEAVCLMGAIHAVCGGPQIGDTRRRAQARYRLGLAGVQRYTDVMTAVIRELFPRSLDADDGIEDFNDAPRRTFAQIHRVAEETDRRMMLEAS